MEGAVYGRVKLERRKKREKCFLTRIIEGKK
jgi:hypothetical protein